MKEALHKTEQKQNKKDTLTGNRKDKIRKSESQFQNLNISIKRVLARDNKEKKRERENKPIQEIIFRMKGFVV